MTRGLYTPPPPRPEELLIEPVFVSAATINITAGEPIDYTMEASNGSYYEWEDFSEFIDDTTNTLAIQDYNIRNIKGTFFQPGTRILTMRAGNSGYPLVEQELTIAVGNPFSDTGVGFENNDYTDATADTSNPLYRLDNASGTPWTMSFWFQPQSNNNSEQTVWSFGGSNQNTEGRVQLYFDGSLDKVVLHYGTNSDFIEIQTPVLSVIDQGRYNIVVTYDGGTTGGAAIDAPLYFSRFKIYVNNVLLTPTEVIGNDGFIGEIVPDAFKFGENINSGNHLRDLTILDEIALWSIDASGVVDLVDDIYNGGVSADLDLLADQPDHWWRMGEGDTFPTLGDSGTVGTLPMTMNNMTAANILTWVTGPTGRSAPPPTEEGLQEFFFYMQQFNISEQIAFVPLIISPLAAAIPAKQPFTYTLQVLNGAEYTWVGLPDTVTVDSNDRTTISGSFDTPGVVPIAVTASSVYGKSTTVTLNVTVGPPFDVLSVNFNNNEYTDATANTSNPLYRLDNVSGTPWTISTWFKAGTSNNAEQTIISFGGSSQANEGRVQLWLDGGNDSVVLHYGVNARSVEKETPNQSILDGEWNHLLITYDGGITGGNIGDNPDSVYLDAFKVYINAQEVMTTGTVNTGAGEEGWVGEIVDEFFRLGQNCSAGNNLRNNCVIGDTALWDLDASAVAGLVDEIYNSGVVGDLSSISEEPEHWWRMGDGDTFPTLQDGGTLGTLDMTMTGMAVGDIVTDSP